MEHTIERLLVDLNSLTLKRLACSNDYPNQIQFRIGSLSGPRIIFAKETEDQYNLSVTDEKNNFYPYPILINHRFFKICQEINQKVYELSLDKEYIALREDQFYKTMQSNLIEIVKPIIRKSKEKSK